MKFEDAVKKSVKAFVAGKLPEALIAARGEDIFFSPDYFDEMEAMFLEEGKAPKKAKKGKTDE